MTHPRLGEEGQNSWQNMTTFILYYKINFSTWDVIFGGYFQISAQPHQRDTPLVDSIQLLPWENANKLMVIASLWSPDPHIEPHLP